MYWSTSELRVSWRRETSLSTPEKYFYWPFQDGTSFVDHLWCLCLVFLKFSRLFIAALWSPAGKGLTSWLFMVMFMIFFFLSLGSAVVLNCTVSLSLSSFLLLFKNHMLFHGPGVLIITPRCMITNQRYRLIDRRTYLKGQDRKYTLYNYVIQQVAR